MCGIFGCVGARQDAANVVLEGIKKLEYRGYDSWGVAVAAGESVVVDKHPGKIGHARVALPPSTAGLGHTRWATHGGVTAANAHPHVDCEGRLAVVHNGIVANHAELRAELAGHRFTSETDTELIVHLVEDALRGQGRTPDALAVAVMVAFRRLRGRNAIAVLDAATGSIVAAKNGSPLVIGVTDSGALLASDADALLEHTRRVAFVREGQAVLLTAASARAFDVERGQERPLEWTLIGWDVHAADKGGHPDYMTKEIHEQPAVLRALATRADSVRALVQAIQHSDDVYAIGCGSGWHAALAAQYLFAAAGRRITAVQASEFSHQSAFVVPGALVLAMSQSGETIDVLEAVGLARDRGARIAALTNVEGSTLFRFADLAVPLGAGPERSVLATKSLVAKLALAYLTARAFAGALDDAFVSIERAAAEIEAMFAGRRRDTIREIASVIAAHRHVYVIGRGVSFALCLETALKIKEVSYIHAEGFAGGELKHGVIALIEPGTPCIVLAPNDGTEEDVLTSAMQVKARGALVIGVGPSAHPVFDNHIQVADLGHAAAIVNAVPAQLLGYDLARLRGTDPDKPRNLAKSVTVK